MSFGDAWGVYGIVGDISSPPNTRNDAPDGQNRDDTSDDGVPDIPPSKNRWSDKNFDHMIFYTLAYPQKYKGSTAGESPNGSKESCSPEFLRRIKHNLNVAKLYYYLGADEELNSLDLCMKSTREELLRLQQEPELFPNKNAEADFWCEVEKCCKLMVERSIPAIEARDEATKFFRESVAKYWQDLVLPTTDGQRKPWEQFLHNGAPGSGADLSQHGHDGSIQILPMAASRIMIAMLVEYNTIVQALDAGGDVPVIDENTPLAEIFPKELLPSPEGNMRAIFPVADLVPVAPAAPSYVPRNEEVKSLETLNQSFARLRGRRGPETRRLWNCVCMVVRDRP